MFIEGEVDKIEMIYTNFKNALKQEPAIRSVLPMEPTGLENDLDEMFQLTSDKGQFAVKKVDEVDL